MACFPSMVIKLILKNIKCIRATEGRCISEREFKAEGLWQRHWGLKLLGVLEETYSGGRWGQARAHLSPLSGRMVLPRSWTRRECRKALFLASRASQSCPFSTERVRGCQPVKLHYEKVTWWLEDVSCLCPWQIHAPCNTALFGDRVGDQLLLVWEEMSRARSGRKRQPRALVRVWGTGQGTEEIPMAGSSQPQ